MNASSLTVMILAGTTKSNMSARLGIPVRCRLSCGEAGAEKTSHQATPHFSNDGKVRINGVCRGS
jgi:hypothetical protein